MSTVTVDTATINDLQESYEISSRAMYMRAAVSFNSIIPRCIVSGEVYDNALSEYCKKLDMDIRIMAIYIRAIGWGGKLEFEKLAIDIYKSTTGEDYKPRSW